MKFSVSSLYLVYNLIFTSDGKIAYTEAIITPHDYKGMGDALLTNPPSCGMPYSELDLSRITAVQLMDKSVDCGACIKLTNAKEPSKFEYVLAVDTGGKGLDVNQDAFEKVFGTRVDPSPAIFQPADDNYCIGIWSKNPRSAAAVKNAVKLNVPDQLKSNDSPIQVAPQSLPTTIAPLQRVDPTATVITTITNQVTDAPITLSISTLQPTNTQQIAKTTETTPSSNANPALLLPTSYLTLLSSIAVSSMLAFI